MNAKFLVPAVGLTLALVGSTFAESPSAAARFSPARPSPGGTGEEPVRWLSNYEQMKKDRAQQLKNFNDYKSIVEGQKSGVLPAGSSPNAILEKVLNNEKLVPVSGAKMSDRLKALQTSTALDLRQSRDANEKLLGDTREVSDMVETMPSAAHKQANSITGNLQQRGDSFKALQRQEASLKARRAGASDPDVAAALDRQIAQNQANQVALTESTKNLLTSNSGLIKQNFDEKLDRLKEDRPDIDFFPGTHLQSLQSKAASLQAQLAQAATPEAAAGIQEELKLVQGEITMQQQVLQRVPR